MTTTPVAFAPVHPGQKVHAGIPTGQSHLGDALYRPACGARKGRGGHNAYEVEGPDGSPARITCVRCRDLAPTPAERDEYAANVEAARAALVKLTRGPGGRPWPTREAADTYGRLHRDALIALHDLAEFAGYVR